MDFRVIAWQARLSAGGVAYRYTVWMGSYNTIECSEEEAEVDAREYLRERHPHLRYEIELELAHPANLVLH